MQVWELCLADLEANPIWMFPMEGEGTDEATVVPLDPKGSIDLNSAHLVRAHFEMANGTSLVGYINWCRPPILENLQPVMFMGDQVISFWFGLAENHVPQIIPQIFPVKCTSESFPPLNSITIDIHGFSFINSTGAIQCVRPSV